MASIKNTFLKGVETIFGVFNEAVKSGTYNVVTDNGFDTPSTSSTPIRCIFEKDFEKDVELLTFYKLIQPNDVIGLIPSVDLGVLELDTQGYCLFGTDRYEVVGHDVDPMTVIYTVLLRKN